MNPQVISSLRDSVFALKTQYEQVHLPAIERIAETAQSLPAGTYKGNGRELLVEAQIRQYLIDPTLEKLGWKLSSPETVVVEAAVEPTETDKNRRYLDYFGRESDGTTSRPLLIVEAKRPSASLPGHPDMQQYERIQKVVEALGGVTDGKKKTKHVGAEWMAWLKTLVDYVRRIHASYGLAPTRVAMTNGEWYLIFTNPQATFVDGRAVTDEIVIFESLESIIARPGEFYELLSAQTLSSLIPVQHPADLHHFAASGSPLDAVLCLEISFNYIQETQPSMSGRAYAKVEVAPSTWITFRIDHTPIHEVFPPKVTTFFDAALSLQGNLERLVADLRMHTPINLVSPAEYEERTKEIYVPSPLTNSALCTTSEPGVFHLVLGDLGFYATQDQQYDECSYHGFGACKSIGFESSPKPFTNPTRSPPVYFHSGSPFHCAHRTVHSQRAKKCIILAFETHMCCRRCAFSKHCWDNTTIDLPCATS